MHNVLNMNGKVAMVTGCNTGLGQGIALALSRAGCSIVGVNSSDPAETAGLIAAEGGRFVDIRARLGSNGTVDQVMQQALEAVGQLDILVNNAGIIRRDDALAFSEQDWDDVLDINLKTVFFLSQSFARHCVAAGHGGKIINVASMLSFQGGIRVPSYTASKSGVLGLTRALANEWAGQGINVNAIAPGYMVTNNTAPLRADTERSQSILQRIPAGRWGLPDDLAGPVVFLASAASDYVHGHTLAVDGGWLAR
jgi:2-deoxy-D-gluconate 3-dehydrogenase